MSTLSVITSQTMSPSVISSPTLTDHEETSPSVMVIDILGIRIARRVIQDSLIRVSAASTMSGTCGTEAVSSCGAYGIGALSPLSRRIGASSR